MTHDELVIWRIVVLLGLAVCIVVVVCLTVLVAFVRSIDRNVVDLWTVTKRMAINTTGLYQLAGTGSIVRALREELLRHQSLMRGG